MWRNSFEGFVASWDSWSPRTIQSGLGECESPVAMNPECQEDSWYFLLSAAFFLLAVLEAAAVSSLGLSLFSNMLSSDFFFFFLTHFG